MRVVFLFCLGVLAVNCHAAVKPHGLISDHAVLQQGIEVPIWGTASEGEKVTVKFQRQEISTVATNGRWLVKLKPLQPGGPFTMTINDVTVNDLLVGEVWLCSGQSNMEWTLGNSANGKATAAAATDSQLRLFRIDNSAPCLTVPSFVDKARWGTGPEVAINFSGVGYFFGRDLRKALQVPVGLIQSAVGGTAIESWMYPRGCLYEKMIAPLQPYAIRGVIWYQGESNCSNAEQYRSLFPTMIDDWRTGWGQGALPFLFVQIAPCNNWTPEIREAQLLSLAKTTNTAMVVTTDVGEANNIHPLRKEPVGARLAIAARAVAYGQKLEFSGPLYKTLNIEGNRAIVTFSHVGQGLEARGGALRGFTIAGADRNFLPATATIERDRVIVSNAAVGQPVAVRYGWASVPDVNLYNKDGLPASPFRTDAP